MAFLLLCALDAERLKVKRTLALWLAFVGPLAVTGFLFLAFWREGEQFLRAPSSNAWTEFGRVIDIFWSFIVLPLFITLQTALLGGLEHSSGQWKHLYALPTPRWIVYASKQISAVALMGLSHVALIGFTVLCGWMLWGLRPDLGFHAPIPWSQVLLPVVFACLGSWLLLAIHTWVGLRWRSFVVGSAVGIVLTVAGVVVIRSEWGSFYPWAIPGAIVNALNKGEPLPVYELLVGCLGGIVISLLGGGGR